MHAVSERWLLPLLEGLLHAFPFVLHGFHADNGSEYINHRVAKLLNKLHIGAFTKSRPRHSNDNALVEGKNAHVVRKWFGHEHIPQRCADDVNRFAQATLSPFLNFHRPCLFATEYRADGKVKRKYLAEDVMTLTPSCARSMTPRATSSPVSASRCWMPWPLRKPTSKPLSAAASSSVNCSSASPAEAVQRR